jgi:hypothetical protein
MHAATISRGRRVLAVAAPDMAKDESRPCPKVCRRSGAAEVSEAAAEAALAAALTSNRPVVDMAVLRAG